MKRLRTVLGLEREAKRHSACRNVTTYKWNVVWFPRVYAAAVLSGRMVCCGKTAISACSALKQRNSVLAIRFVIKASEWRQLTSYIQRTLPYRAASSFDSLQRSE